MIIASIKKGIYINFARLVHILSGSHISRIPGVLEVYKFLYYSLLPKDSLVKVKIFGNTLVVDAKDMGGVGLSIIFDKIYHRTMTNYLQNTIKEGMVFVDIGANIGYFSVIASKLVGNSGKVIAFEPEKHNFELLEMNVQINACNNISCINKAISNIESNSDLFVDKISFGSASLVSPSKYVRTFSHEKYLVETISLDKFIDTKVDIVKIDVEGYETKVIDGMKRILLENRDIILIVEYIPYGAVRINRKPCEMFDALTNVGFSLFDIDERNNKVCPITADVIIKKYTGNETTNILARRIHE